MLLLPAVGLRQGKIVQLVAEDAIDATAARPPADDQAELWREARATWVHVIDLDAAFGQRSQWAMLPPILGQRVRVQFGGGIRSMLQVQQLIELGVERVVVGTQGVRNPLWVRELCRVFPGRIVLAVDAKGREVVVSGWTEGTGHDVVDLARTLDDAGLAGFLFTAVAKAGSKDIDRETIEALRRNTPRTPLFVAGGVSTLDDLAWLDEVGVHGVVLESGIYSGDIDLAEAIRRFPQPKTDAHLLQVLAAREDLVEQDLVEAEAIQDRDPEDSEGFEED